LSESAPPAPAHAWLRELILGGQDGLVNVLGITLGVSAASADVKVLLAAGLAATFAEGVSMGAVAYTSSMTQADHYESERIRQEALLKNDPARAREELARIYSAKGFEGELLERIVATIAADEKTALTTLMREGVGLEPADERFVLRSAGVVGVATIVGSLIPLIPFFFFRRIEALWAAVAISALALFCVGAYEAKTSVGDWRKKGLQMTVIGLSAAFVGYLAGKVFGAE
jgi:VIT1/CCC1 family predicted Fe2+/Mn2+ transporter